MSKAHFIGSGSTKPLLAGGKPVLKWWLWWPVPIFSFRNDPDDPLTWIDENGTAYQPDRHFITDGGSIPPPLWGSGLLRLSPWLCPRGYPMHDSGYQYGGLYVRGPLDMDFTFRLIGRIELNRMLGEWIMADGGTRLQKWAVRTGLMLGSWSAWSTRRQAAARKRDGIVVAQECKPERDSVDP